MRSVLPEGAIERVQVLEYGDDPEVEPGETAIRVLIASGPPEDEDAAGENLRDFHEANRAAIKRLRPDLPRFIGWIEFRPDRPADPARPHGPMLKLKIGGDRGRECPPGEAAELTPVMTRLGPADLATVDTLITAASRTAAQRSCAGPWAASASARRMPSSRSGYTRSTSSKPSSSGIRPIGHVADR